MGDVYDLLDETGSPVRETRQLSDQNGTAGQFLRVGSDKTVSAATLSSYGAVTLTSLAFAFDTAALTTGVAILTPAIGDVIYDIGVSVTVAFNGTTPKADVGTFNGGNVGLFGELGTVVDLSNADDAVTDNAGLAVGHAANWLQASIGSVGAAASAAYISGQLVVTAANPLVLVVSQNGQKSGTAIGGSAGSGLVYVLHATPL
jgi:hypothetical protein